MCALQVCSCSWLCMALCGLGYLISVATIVRAWTRPLEKLIEIVDGNPKEGSHLSDKILSQWGKKNEFTQFALKLYAMHEKIREQTDQGHQKDREMDGILNSLNEGVIAFNARAQVIFINTIAMKMLSCAENTAIGKFLPSLASQLAKQPPSLQSSPLQDEDLQGKLKLFQKCHEGVLHALQTAEMSKQSWTTKEKHFDLIASPLIHQEGAVLVIQDKTSDSKVLEVGKNFIANASHELRTPITILRGFAEMLQNMSRLSPHTVVEITHKMVRTCDRLNTLIKSLLTIADLEQFSSQKFRSVHLFSLLEKCKYQLLMTYPHAQLTLSCKQEEGWVLADSDLLDLALMNLLENGVKYSGDPSQAHLQMGFEIKDNEVVLMLSDQGIGIPKEDLPHIFDRFYTVDKARQRKSGGVGLGLSIVKTIIEKHQGRIDVTSEMGKGTLFTITLRLGENREQDLACKTDPEEAVF